MSTLVQAFVPIYSISEMVSISTGSIQFVLLTAWTDRRVVRTVSPSPLNGFCRINSKTVAADSQCLFGEVYREPVAATFRHKKAILINQAPSVATFGSNLAGLKHSKLSHSKAPSLHCRQHGRSRRGKVIHPFRGARRGERHGDCFRTACSCLAARPSRMPAAQEEERREAAFRN